MTIHTFTAHHFRNYTNLYIEPSPMLNVFFGQNASGKTSLLEAIFYLGMGRSFRTRLLDRVIQHEAPGFRLFASILYKTNRLPLGLERIRNGERRLHVDGQPTSQSAAIKHLPLLFISTNNYRYFYDGPKARRNFLDWGVFHVKHKFYTLWQDSQKLLKQRNAGLRQGLNRAQLQVWDYEFVKIAEQIDQLRSEYIDQLTPIVIQLLMKFEPSQPLSITLQYERGWATDKNLMDVLAANWHHDLRLGYTQAGPQRADLRVYAGSVPAQDVLSQGQQKQVAYALYLAQGLLFNQINQTSPIYLIDDLPAELDLSKCQCVAKILSELNAQVFVTGISQDNFDDLFLDSPLQMFHVKHGKISAV